MTLNFRPPHKPAPSCSYKERCCSGGDDPKNPGTPLFVCSTLKLPSTKYRCYHFKEIAQVGDASLPVTTKLKARLKSEIQSVLVADDECAHPELPRASATPPLCLRPETSTQAFRAFPRPRVDSGDLHLLIFVCIVVLLLGIGGCCGVLYLYHQFRMQLAQRPEAEKLTVRPRLRTRAHAPRHALPTPEAPDPRRH